ncbi:MAG: hypothetical protein EOM70_00925 [Clostridia bacterium]|nr:hypothetical protein [Clostridia bacterium]
MATWHRNGPEHFFPSAGRPIAGAIPFSQRACFDQYYHYTFTQRLKIPKVLAATLAWPLSFFIAGVMRSMRAIPVHRDLYDGFLDLERFCLRKTGQHFSFIPLQIDHPKRQIVSIEPYHSLQ